MRPVLITCGATRNPVDGFRFISNGASGATGLHLARALAGRSVTVLASLEAALRAPDRPVTVYTTTRDLMDRVQAWCVAHSDGVILHSAAVGDYEVLGAAGKLPSGRAELIVRLTPTPKIIDHIRIWAPDSFLVSFKAGAHGISPAELEALARAQARRTGSSWVFANALDHPESDVQLVSPDTCERFADRADAVAALLARLP